MSVNRRNFLKTSAGAAFAATLFDGSTAASSQGRADVPGFEDALMGYGYRPVPAADLITGEAFNGGVRYDENGDHFPGTNAGAPEKRLVVQDCSRVEDATRGSVPGVLAYFHILAFVDNAPARRGIVLEQALELLTGAANLDVDRILLVSTEQGSKYVNIAGSAGIASDQVVMRTLAEAKAAGDGSGYFSPEGHPHISGLHTISFHYVPQGVALASEPKYPLEKTLEIGEFGFHDPESGPELVGFGVERILMAQGFPTLDFAQSRDLLLEKLRAEADRRNVPLPPAYQTFAKV